MKLRLALGFAMSIMMSSAAYATPVLHIGATEIVNILGFALEGAGWPFQPLPSGVSVSSLGGQADIQLDESSWGSWHRHVSQSVTITNNSSIADGYILGMYYSTAMGGSSPYVYLGGPLHYGLYDSVAYYTYDGLVAGYDHHQCNTWIGPFDGESGDCTNSMGADYNQEMVYFALPAPGGSATLTVTAEIYAALIPEPASVTILGAGLAASLVAARKWRPASSRRRV